MNISSFNQIFVIKLDSKSSKKLKKFEFLSFYYNLDSKKLKNNSKKLEFFEFFRVELSLSFGRRYKITPWKISHGYQLVQEEEHVFFKTKQTKKN